MYKTKSLVTVIGAVFCAGALALTPATAQAQECLPAPDGLASWWPGDGNATDIQGANNGTLEGGATFAAGFVTSGTGEAFSFDGVNDYVNLGSSAVFDLLDFTIDVWVFIDPTTNIGNKRVVSRDDVLSPTNTGPREFYALATSSNGCGPPFNVPSMGIFDETGASMGVCGTTPLSAGWRHLAGVRSGGTLSVYVDGQLAVTATGTATGSISPEAPLVVGQVSPFFNGEFFNGLADEVEIFNRALSAGEIQAIYNAATDGKCKDEDGDGFRPPDDCDESDPEVNPNATENSFNFVDENCDGDLGECDPCIAWSNHGQYVRCVADAVSDCSTNSFTQEEADAFVSSAVHSDIGKTGFVPPECGP